jgi:galactonate dehydratase
MKVTGVKTYLYHGHFNWLLVKLETDEGIEGWGEATTQSSERATQAHVHTIGENYLMGKDPRQIELHVSTLMRNSYWKPSFVIYSAISGLEMAMWDIFGKSLNVPVYTLLGGACRPRLKMYHNGWWFGAKSYDDYARLAKDMVDKGAKALKFDPMQGMDTFIDTAELNRTVEAFRLVREAVGDEVELMVDVHGRLSPDNAIRLARALEPYRPYWWEEPLPTDASGPVLTAASIQLEAAIPNFLIHEFFSIDIPFYEEVLKEKFPVITENNYIELPTKPGLGIEIDEAALSKRPYKYADLSAFWATHDDWREATDRK